MKKMLIVISAVFVVLIAVYLIMFFNTNSLMNDVEDVMKGNISKEVTAGLPVDMYNRKGDLGTTSVNVKIHRIFVLNNFFDGYVWVNYTCEGFDSSGKQTYGSWKVNSCWKIHKNNGKWEIIAIYEGP